MKRLDMILELVKDSQWHSIDEIKDHVPVSAEGLKCLLTFLDESDFIEFENSNERLKIKPLGLRLLELKTEQSF
jgi:hypothetical protein